MSAPNFPDNPSKSYFSLDKSHYTLLMRLQQFSLDVCSYDAHTFATISSHCKIPYQENKQKKNVAVLDVTDQYLLQLLMPFLLANDLTMENHRGGTQTERHRLSHPALHKRLQVRVQLHKGGGGAHLSNWTEAVIPLIRPTHKMNR